MIDRTTTPIMEPEPGVLEATRRCALQLALLEDMPPAACGEYVVTPPWFVASLCQSIGLWPWGQRILDAGAGTGEIGCEVARWAAMIRPSGPAPIITGVELYRERFVELTSAPGPDGQPAYDATICADLLQWAPGIKARWPIIITNPPFSLWKEWIEVLLKLLGGCGRLFVVLPWEYISRAEDWWRARPAFRVWRTARRPWKIETREACWVEWMQGRDPVRPTELRWLEI